MKNRSNFDSQKEQDSNDPGTAFYQPAPDATSDFKSEMGDLPSADDHAEWPGQAGRYQLREEIARGGMGIVLRAIDPSFQRTLAVKIMRQPETGEPERRFREEARIAGQLQHPGIPPLYDLGQLENGTPFFAMKLIEGHTLAALLNDRADPKDSLLRFVNIFEQICQTLAYAHSNGVIHRDLKPANIMVGSFGEVQVMDWGLAKRMKDEGGRMNDEGTKDQDDLDSSFILHSSSFQTQAGVALGTPAYMPPEQARGEIERLDESTDVFGLGAILCEIFTGKPPFAGGGAIENQRLAARGDVSDAIDRLDQCGANDDLVQLAKTCLAPAMENRPRHAGEVAAAVSSYQMRMQEKLRQAELERKEAQVRTAEERKRRKFQFGLAAATLVIVVGAAVAGIWYFREQDRQQAENAARKNNVEQRVTTALDDVDRRRTELQESLDNPRQADRLLSDLEAWERKVKSARLAWQRAESLVSNNPNVVSRMILKRMESLDKRLKTDENNRQLGIALDKIRVEAATPVRSRLKTTALSPRYADVFQKARLDLDDGEPQQIARQLKALPIRHALLSALDHWSMIDKKRRPRLLEIARRVDPDPWRDRFRNPKIWEDRAALQKLALEVDPAKQSPQILEALASCLHRVGADTTNMLRRALVHHPDNFYLLYQLGKTTYVPTLRTGAYRSALALRPKSNEALLRLAKTLGDSRRVEEAIAYYQKTLEIDNEYGLAHNNLASLFGNQREFKKGIYHARHAVRINPEQPGTHRTLALLLRRTGRSKEAKDLLQKALDSLRINDIGRLMLTRELQLCERFFALAQTEKLISIDAKTARIGVRGTLTNDLPKIPYPPGSYRRAYGMRFKAGQAYLIDLEGDFDTLIQIEDNHFNPLMYNDDVAPRGNLNSRIVFTPTKSDMYRLVVTSFTPGVTGQYTLKVRPTTKDGAMQTIAGDLRITKKDLRGKFADFHKIKLTGAAPHTIELKSESFDTYLVLMDSAELALATNDDLAPSDTRSSRLDFTPPSDGVYVVGVTSFGPSQTGPYTLQIQRYAVVE